MPHSSQAQDPALSGSSIPVVLAMAGIDPSGGAGLLADVQVINRQGCHAMGVVTLETVQDTSGVRRIVPADPDLLAEQVEMAAQDIAPHALKLGALGSLAMVKRLARLLREKPWAGIPMVLDTVLQSTSGAPLMAPAALGIFQEELLPIATVITPNLGEFALLARGAGLKKADDGLWAADESALEAALAEYGSRLPCAILLKGGHLAGNPTDRLWHAGKLTRFPGHRWVTRSTHGTGCALSSALACALARGEGLETAAGMAKSFVAEALKTAPGLGRGRGPLGLRAGPGFR